MGKDRYKKRVVYCFYLLKEPLHGRRLTDSCLYALTEVAKLSEIKTILWVMGHKVFCFEAELNSNFWLRSNVVTSVMCASG